jgi:Ca2+-binding RTX toxin-like protein
VISSVREWRAGLVLSTVLALGPAALLQPAAKAVGGAVTCAGEPATVVGTAGDDVLTGTRGRDVIAGLEGDDVVRGGRGDDVLCGDDGADVVRGGRGDDVLRDHVVDSTDQVLDGGPGRDALTFGWEVREDGQVQRVEMRTDLHEGRAVIGDTGVSFPFRSFRSVTALMSVGHWEVRGTPGPDVFTTAQYLTVAARGGAGRDVLRGSWHDDVLRGGPGRDTAYADRGRDVCVSVERGPLGECETLR